MAETIPVEVFRGALLAVLDEMFERGNDLVLDPGDALFETLATLDATQATRPIGEGESSIAALVHHLWTMLDQLNRAGGSKPPAPTDWGASWHRLSIETDADWRTLVADLRRAFDTLRGVAASTERWDAHWVDGALALVAHASYHIGEVRRSLAVLRETAPASP
ncbi:MAG: hypothetical protein M3462_08675 [Chloroflexota bacterium]|nr:hypothetical protein [Chloroflexota bacterium]